MLFDLILKDSTVLFLDKFYIPLDYFDRKVIFYDFKQFSAKLFAIFMAHKKLSSFVGHKIAYFRYFSASIRLSCGE